MPDFPFPTSNNQVTEDLAGAFHFLLELETVNHGPREIIAGFNGISGGGVKVEKRDVTTGDDPHKMHQPGSIDYENITLSRGLTTNTDLLDWFQDIVEGSIDRRSGALIIHDHDNQTEVARYEFFNAWPCSWNVPDMAADQSGMAIEKIEIAVEKVERA